MTLDFNDYLSEEGKLRTETVMQLPNNGDIISLALGLPHPSNFPVQSLSIGLSSPQGNPLTLTESKILPSASQYLSGTGLTELRKCLEEQYLKKFNLEPKYNNWDYLVQTGSTQSLDSLFRLLINRGVDSILCEELTYSCFLETAKPFDVGMVSIKMDDFGIIPSEIDKVLLNWPSNKVLPKFLYTVPNGHNPTGVTMTVERRKDLMDVCSKHNMLVIEDDPYYHLNLDDAKMMPSLLNFDTKGLVIRIDSFSKILMPGLRLSVVVANELFIQKLEMHNDLSVHSASGYSQLILLMILQKWGSDGLDQWLSQLSNNYRVKRDVMYEAFAKYLPLDLVSFNKPECGMFIWVTMNLGKFRNNSTKSDSEWSFYVENLIFERAMNKYKVILTKGHHFSSTSESVFAGFRASFSYVENAEIVKAAQNFGLAIQDVYDELYSA